MYGLFGLFVLVCVLIIIVSIMAVVISTIAQMVVHRDIEFKTSFAIALIYSIISILIRYLLVSTIGIGSGMVLLAIMVPLNILLLSGLIAGMGEIKPKEGLIVALINTGVWYAFWLVMGLVFSFGMFG